MMIRHPRNVVRSTSYSIRRGPRMLVRQLVTPRLAAKKQPDTSDSSPSSSQPQFSKDLLGPSWTNRGRLSDDMLSSLLSLPGTRGMNELRERAEALATWKMALQRGTIPKLDELNWPQEPFKTKFAAALTQMEMPRFTRRYPAILDTLMKQMIGLVNDFETQLAAEEESQSKQNQQQQQQQQQQQPQQNQQQQQQPGQGQGGEGQKQDKGEKGEEQEQEQQEGQGEGGEMELDEEMMKQMMEEMKEMKEKQNKASQSQSPSGKEIKIQLELKEEDGTPDEKARQMQLKIEQAAESIVSNFQKQMEEVMKNLEEGEMVFDDLGDLLEGSDGFDLARGTWRKSGWRELSELRRVLEDCVELRQLVRELGRGGGKGPLRRAPEQLESPGLPPGVIRSPLQPEEVRGLTRSGELSRMLPSEMALLAHGWPRKVRDDGKGDKEQDESSSSGEFDSKVYYLPGAHAARMLHRVRRAERMLMSYDRTGWLDDQPSKLTDRTEIRPAAELGPIILCLDTSGSMRGARETVAKALALECLRGAMRQRRACFLYAFSGPDDVQELELKVDMDSLDSLLDFLSCSFMGGTDVDQPLKLSLERLKSKPEWAMADILMVTDGEIPMPDASILSTIQTMNETVGLKVHGLLVASQVTEPMQKLCTKLHTFKSWSAVGGKDYMN